MSGKRPWKAVPALDSAYEWDIVDADGIRIAEVLHPDRGGGTESRGHLMAAAPELLDALDALMRTLAGRPDVVISLLNDGFKPVWDQSRAATVKARGES